MDLETIIKNEISASGFLSINDFMQRALYHPEHGYYIKSSPLGAKADFITAPEVSQLFGESLAVYLLSNIIKNFPDVRLNLLEIGAGKGTLMADILRVFSKFPEVFDRLDIFIIEVNEPLKKAQAELLANYNVKWVSSINEMPVQPSIIYANELFDCFPVQQFVSKDKKWLEAGFELQQGRVVATTRANDILVSKTLPESLSNASDGSVFEYSPMVVQYATELFSFIKQSKGVFLTLDYGYFEPPLKDSVQSLYRHNFNPLTENIGNADITAYVDFGLLARIARENGLRNPTLSTQRQFLLNCGIALRAQKLAENKAAPVKEAIFTDLERLSGESQMGNNFKTLAIIEI
jgi:NADH dehydrogenase [ubiquinone] 1 alpha subcomplex assembly factor 7